MTGPEDDHSNTRPISVAELLARNGTIGAPPVGGRRRRRRGADSVTVAELTGEIPIIRDDDAPATGRSAAATVEAPAEPEPVAPAEAVDAEPATEAAEAAPAETAETAEAAAANGAVDHTEETVEEEALEVPEDEPLEASDTETSDVDSEALEDEAGAAAGADEDNDYADSDYQTHIEQRDADEDLDFFAPPRRSTFARRRFGMLGRSAPAEPSDAQVGAEEMSPDPVDWADPDADEDEAADAAVAVTEPEQDDERDDRPSYLRSPDDALFGGPDVDDDVARPNNGLSPADVDLDEEDVPRSGAMSSFLRGAMVVGQCVVAVAFGAGLFIAFDQLWKWNSIVALVLGVLVILGLVVGVRVVRKTEDIGSTLIAVAVGAMVTFGPLALMQAA
ncbi:hypothetical protein [Mycobacterium sp. 852014-52144_SCH5372336]|uniref:hypothetical protein n=1 Tax=Mycobacterium sp. 852014-52144_SCH5372336 TaxID=1834115 RepID=UPI0007FCDCEB|nr:hypothetical protein [Mycobacterium sp. 852014-52144_SCH5372336]OBB72255.1 hypothetical protein A5759_20040 [Mycobacterium sp. 852014-52144_SCH5372336]